MRSTVSWMTAIVGTLVGVAGIGLSYFMYVASRARSSIPVHGSGRCMRRR